MISVFIVDKRQLVCESSLMQQNEPTKAQIKKWRRYLADERVEAATYERLAKKRQGTQREIVQELARAEHRHEQHWMRLLGEHAYPPPKPSLRARMLPALAGMFGSVFVLALAQRSEQRTAYDSDADATPHMAADEHIHGEVVRSLGAESRTHMAGSFRAAVFGANDGLMSNLALILGVAAAGMESHLVMTTGIAGLLAGSLSMGAGEWVSVSSQRELLDASVPDPEAHRSVPNLDVNANELELIFRARGEDPDHAKAHAADVFAVVGKPADTESGPLPLRVALGEGTVSAGADDSLGTPWQAGISSFCFFAIGALIPLLPFIFGVVGIPAIIISVTIVGATLLGTGGIVGILSGRPAWRGALRQLIVGYGAAAVTYGLGTLFGAAIG